MGTFVIRKAPGLYLTSDIKKTVYSKRKYSSYKKIAIFYVHILCLEKGGGVTIDQSLWRSLTSELWGALLGHTASSDVMRPLIYPLVQVDRLKIPSFQVTNTLFLKYSTGTYWRFYLYWVVMIRRYGQEVCCKRLFGTIPYRITAIKSSIFSRTEILLYVQVNIFYNRVIFCVSGKE